MTFDRPPVTQRPTAQEKAAADDRIEIPGSTLKMRPPKEKPRKPLKRSARKVTKMSADAKVQDAMLGKGRCWLTDYPKHNCTDGRSQRAHIVKQTIIAEAFPNGVWRRPRGTIEYKTVTLQEILDDTRNIVPVCPNGNRDGAEMVDALAAVGYPDGFDDFCREYGFEFNGRFWYREAS